MTNANDPITLLHSASSKDILFQGLTKREYFAAMAMQGFLATYSGEHLDPKPDHIAKRSSEYADALIKALNEQ